MTAPATAPPFVDRGAGGAELARIAGKRGFTNSVVVGIPPGGVEVAATLANIMGVPLEVVGASYVGMVEDIQHAVGGVAEDGATVFDPSFEPGFAMMGMIDSAAEMARAEVSNQTATLRDGRPFREVGGKQALVVTDLIRIPWVILAAAEMVRQRGATRVALCSPVGAEGAAERLELRGLELLCPVRIPGFPDITDCYEDAEPPHPARIKALLSQLAADYDYTPEPI